MEESATSPQFDAPDANNTPRRRTPHTRQTRDSRSVAQRLHEMARNAGPNAKLPTVRQLCQLLDTSLQTLDDAMSDLEAQNVISRRQGSGVYVSARVNYRTVAVLLDSTFFEQVGVSPVWGMLWGLITQEAHRRAMFQNQTLSFHLIAQPASAADELPEGLRRKIERGQLDGALSIGLGNALLAWIADHVPLVAFAGGAPYHIELAVEEVVRQATRCLAAQGCRRIAFWRPGQPHPEAELETFRRTLRDFDLPYRPEIMRVLPSDPSRRNGEPPQSRHEQGRQVAMEVFGNCDVAWPDGIVISDDMMTAGALSVMYKLRVWAGEDVKIASQANAGSHVLHGYEEMITRVEFDPAEVVHTMFDMLEALMSGQELPNPVVRIAPVLHAAGRT